MALYHKDIGFPHGVKLPAEYVLRYSQHAVDQSRRKGINYLPVAIEVNQGNLIELEVVAGKPFKAVFRVQYNATHDLCLALLLDGTVKTVWLNSKTDLHGTLDASKYDKPVQP